MAKTAVIIPCYNEEITIQKVIEDFTRELPNAQIYVFDNNSVDNTVSIAEKMGASVYHVKRQGKGAVMREAFQKIEADFYVMVDGDDTYPPDNIKKLIDCVASGRADMAIGNRLKSNYFSENKSLLHGFGNLIVPFTFRLLYKIDIEDIMSGSRVLSRAFAKSFPAKYDGFEIETEMMIFAAKNNYKITSIPVPYRDRPEGSFSKIHAVKDGSKILKLIVSSKFSFKKKPVTYGEYAQSTFIKKA